MGDLRLDFRQHRVTLAGDQLRLTPLEYRLLVELAVYAGEIVPHERLLERLWGLANSGDPRPLRTVVKSLRRKLGDDASDPVYLFTEPGIGYRLAREENAGA